MIYGRSRGPCGGRPVFFHANFTSLPFVLRVPVMFPHWAKCWSGLPACLLCSLPRWPLQKHNTIMSSTATLLSCRGDKTRTLSSHNFYESVLICRWRAHIPRHSNGSSCLSTSSSPHGDQCQRWLTVLGINRRLLCVDGTQPHVVLCGTLKRTRGIVASLLLSLAKTAFNK